MRFEKSLSKGNLVIAAGFASETGRRADNQDFGAIHLGTVAERLNHGIIAVVADGVSGGKAGRTAAELAVQMLIEGFYAMPPTIGPAKAIDRAASAFNEWLYKARECALKPAGSIGFRPSARPSICPSPVASTTKLV